MTRLSARTLAMAGALTALGIVLLAAILVARAHEDAPPPEASATTEASLAASAADLLPSLTDDCRLVAQFRVGSDSIRVGVPQLVEVLPEPCAVKRWGAMPPGALTMMVAWRLAPPDGPREIKVELAADLTEGLTWHGTVTFPAGGKWVPRISVAARTENLESQTVFTNVELAARLGLPVEAVPQQLTVLHLDRSEEPVRWDATRGGLAWLPGLVPGDAARAVWVQPRNGQDWVVAGDPTTGIVTPLFEVDGESELIGAPDGRALVAIDHPEFWARVRIYDAERGFLVAVPTLESQQPNVAWAPDSSKVLVTDDRVHLLTSAGRELFSAALPGQEAEVEWASNSRQALLLVSFEGGGRRLFQLDAAAGSLFQVHLGDPTRESFTSAAAYSPDGKSFAVSWLDPAGLRSLVIAVAPADLPASGSVDAYIVASLPALGHGGDPSITPLIWSPDGRSLAFGVTAEQLPLTENPDGEVITSLHLLEVQSRAERTLTSPSAGNYLGIPLVWSADGTALFVCGKCGARRPSIDVIDVAAGNVVRRIEGAEWLGNIDGVRQLISANGALLSVRSLEAPRVLFSDPAGQPYAYLVAPSPDGNRLSILGATGVFGTIASVNADGSEQHVLGFVTDWRSVRGVAGPDRVLQRAGTEWVWRSLAGGLPALAPRLASTYDPLEVDSAFTPDGSYAAYWIDDEERDRRRLAIFDSSQNAARPLDVFASRQGPIQAMALTSDGRRVAYLEASTLVIVDTSTGRSRRIDLSPVNPLSPRVGLILSLTWSGGTNVELIAAGALWRVDAESGLVSAVPGTQPSPGGYSVAPRLSRSPDGHYLAVATRYGVFVRPDGGDWRQVIGRGDQKEGPLTRLVWSPDSRYIAFDGDPDRGIVVAAIDGSEAHQLVRTSPSLRLLQWLPDARIVYLVGSALSY